jgi:hypothetical protein
MKIKPLSRASATTEDESGLFWTTGKGKQGVTGEDQNRESKKGCRERVALRAQHGKTVVGGLSYPEDARTI